MEVSLRAEKRKNSTSSNGTERQSEPPSKRNQSGNGLTVELGTNASKNGHKNGTEPAQGNEQGDTEHTRVQARQKLASRGKTRLSRVKSVLMRQNASYRTIPKSVEAPIDVGDLSSVKSSDIIECAVILLDGARRDLRANRKTCTGQDLMDALARHLGLTETEFFGLTYCDPNMVWHWLRMHKLLKRDLRGNAPVFEFQAKFYPSDPQIDMRDDVTRYFLCCQVRQDVLSGSLPCSFWSLVVLAAYCVQADFGDCDDFAQMLEEQHKTVYDFFRNYPIAPAEQQSNLLIDEVCELHKVLRGITQSEADLGFLQHAAAMASYGMDFHRAQSDGEPVLLGVNHEGISLYRDRIRLYRYTWSRIAKLTYLKNSFTIHLQPFQNGQNVRPSTSGNDDDASNKHVFTFPNKSHYKLSKRCFRCAVDNHWFFKLKTPDESLKTQQRVIANVFRPAFREIPGYYVGPTQEQLRKRRPDSAYSTLGRTQSIRLSNVSNRSSEWSSVTDLRRGSVTSLRMDESPAPARRQHIPSGDVLVSGRGVQPKGIRVGETVELVVARRSGEVLPTQPTVTCQGPNGDLLPLRVQTRRGSFAFSYEPLQNGPHRVRVQVDGQHAFGSPFNVTVSQQVTSCVRVCGPGLERAVESEPAIFTLHGNGSQKTVSYEVRGPQDIATHCRSLTRPDGCEDVCYIPPVRGQYAVHVREDGEDVPGSPWVVDAIPQYPLLLQEEQVVASGPGLQPGGLKAESPTQFTVESQDVNSFLINVACFNVLNGSQVPVDTKINPAQTNFRTCKYTPNNDGPFVVYVTVADINVPGSPFHILVQPPSLPEKPALIVAPSVPTPKAESTPVIAEFNGEAPMAPLSEEPEETVASEAPLPLPESTPVVEEVCEAPLIARTKRSTALQAARLKSQQINQNSSLDVDVGPIRASGRGLLPRGVRVNDKANFVVRLNGAKGGEFQVKVADDQSNQVPCKVESDPDGNYTCSYEPSKAGKHVVDLTYGGKQIRESPFSVEVGEPAENKVLAFGPGLREGIADKRAVFTVSGEQDALNSVDVQVDGPSKTTIATELKPDGSVDVTYVPKEAGEYFVNVEEQEQHVENSPFVVQVRSALAQQVAAIEKVTASGAGLNRDTVVRQKRAKFIVDVSECDIALEPIVTCYKVKNGEEIPVKARRSRKPKFKCSYYAPDDGWVVVYVTMAGCHVNGSPFHVNVLPNDAAKVRITGLGLSDAVENESNSFTIEHGDSVHPDKVSVSLRDYNGKRIPVQIEDLDDSNAMSISYTPTSQTPIIAAITVDNDHIPGSPFHVSVSPSAEQEGNEAQGHAQETAEHSDAQDADAHKKETPDSAELHEADVHQDGTAKDAHAEAHENEVPKLPEVTVSGPGVQPFGVRAAERNHFSVLAPQCDLQRIQITVLAPDAQPLPVDVQLEAPSMSCSYVPAVVGTHSVAVKFDSQHVPDSPFSVNVQEPGPDVKAYGPGLLTAFTGIPTTFTLAPAGKHVSVSVDGPGKAKVKSNVYDDGTIDTNYTVPVEGQYTISVTTKDLRDNNSTVTHVRHSPWVLLAAAAARPNANAASKVKANGSGLLSAPLGDTVATFSIDTSRAAPIADATPLVTCFDADSASPINVTMTQTGPQNFLCQYAAGNSRNLVAYVTYNGVNIRGSPFHIPVVEPKKMPHFDIGGRGVQAKGIRVGELVDFTIRGDEASQTVATLTGPAPSDAQQTVKSRGQRSECVGSYILRDPGLYSLRITYDDKDVAGSPFSIQVGPNSDSSAVAFGMGLYFAMLAQPAYFRVNPDADPTRTISVTVDCKGSQVQVPCKLEQQPNGSFDVSFTPQTAGEHALHVMAAGEDIRNSPWMLDVLPAPSSLPNADDILVTGPGIGKQVVVNVPTQFTVDTRKTTADAPLLIMAFDAVNATRVDVQKLLNADCTYCCSYTPTDTHLLLLYASYANVPLPGSPFKVDVVPPDPVQTDNQDQEIVVKSKTKTLEKTPAAQKDIETATDKLVDTLTQLLNMPIDMPPQSEDTDSDVQLPSITADKQPDHLLAAVTMWMPVVYGPGIERAVASKPASFSIYTKGIAPNRLAVKVTGPCKTSVDCEPKPDGTTDVRYLPTVPGQYNVHVLLDGNDLQNSPWPVQVSEAPEDVRNGAQLVTAIGRGLKRLSKNDTVAPFTVDASRAVAVAPDEVQVACFDSRTGAKLPCELRPKPGSDKQWDCQYTPNGKFDHNLIVYVTYGGVNIARSPFHVLVSNDKTGPNSVSAFGPGLTRGLLGHPVRFTLFLNGVRDEVIRVAVENPQGDRVQTDAKRCEDGTLDVTFSPAAPGDLLVSITEQNEHILNSPWTVNLREPDTSQTSEPGSLAHLVRVDGPGLRQDDVRASEFTVDPRPIGDLHDPQLVVACFEINGTPIDTKMTPKHDGTIECSYEPKQTGPHVVYVTSGDVNVLGSPYHVKVAELPQPKQQEPDAEADADADADVEADADEPEIITPSVSKKRLFSAPPRPSTAKATKDPNNAGEQPSTGNEQEPNAINAEAPPADNQPDLTATNAEPPLNNTWTVEGESENEENFDPEAVKGGKKRVRTKKKPTYTIGLISSLRAAPCDPQKDSLDCGVSADQKSTKEQKHDDPQTSKSDEGRDTTTNTVVEDNHIIADLKLVLDVPSDILEAIQRVKTDSLC